MLEKQFEAAIHRFSKKDKELEALGYTREQIVSILQINNEKPDEAALKAAVAKLRAEASALEMFTRDYPRYDLSVLKGTSLESAASPVVFIGGL